jgi:hypothetical protein
MPLLRVRRDAADQVSELGDCLGDVGIVLLPGHPRSRRRSIEAVRLITNSEERMVAGAVAGCGLPEQGKQSLARGRATAGNGRPRPS